MVDLRQEFAKLMDEFGSYGILIRNDKKQKCKCVSNNLAPSDKCQICLGTGYINSAERIRMRTRSLGGAARAGRLVNIGPIDVGTRQFYLEYTETPKRQDLLILCGWDGLKPVLDDYTEIYEVIRAEPMRGENGRVEYFSVSTKSDPVNMNARFFNLQQNAEKLTYYLTVR